MITDDKLTKKINVPYEQALERVKAALKEEGFGVLTEIDVRATLKEKLDLEFRRYDIIGACNPPLAHRALSADLEVGLMLPCNVIVYEDGEGSVVKAFDPQAALGLIDNPEVASVASDARARLERAVGAL